LGCFYELQNKENKIGNFETLTQNRFGTSFSYAGEKITVNGEVSFYQNNSMAIPSSVGFQMLEGLQTGKPYVEITLQKKHYPIHGYQLKLPGPKK
jgi:hypothetical protein